MFGVINNIVLLFLIMCINKECLCDICKTCICSATDSGPIVDCNERHLDTNEFLNFDLLTLDHHQSLNKLILSRNNIISLNTHVLKNLIQLKKLDLSQNRLGRAHADIFKDLRNLKELDYSNNLLWDFDVSTLNIIPSLVKLNLSYNHISSLERSSHSTDIKLKILDLSHNNLSDLCKDFLDSLTELEYFDLSFNKLANLQVDSLVYLRQLRVIYINNNYFHSLHLRDLPSSLTKLDARNNLINVLSFQKSFIRILNLGNNQISDLRQNLTLLEEVRYLNLSGNYLSDFPFALHKLETLDLSFNNFSVIPPSISIKNFPMLKMFSMDGNYLKNLKVSSELSLEVFEVSFMDDIKEIRRETFAKLGEKRNSCINITISNNAQLNVIQENVFQHMNVCSIDLSNNHFTYLSSMLIYNNKNNAKCAVNLQGNPFVCNCSMQWILDDFVPFLYITNPSLLENLRCAAPSPLTNKRLVHWYQWQDKIFCSNFSERITIGISEVFDKQVVTFESSPGMLAVLGILIALLAILIIIGILLTRRMMTKKRRINRRF